MVCRWQVCRENLFVVLEVLAFAEVEVSLGKRQPFLVEHIIHENPIARPVNIRASHLAGLELTDLFRVFLGKILTVQLVVDDPTQEEASMNVCLFLAEIFRELALKMLFRLIEDDGVRHRSHSTRSRTTDCTGFIAFMSGRFSRLLSKNGFR